MFSFHSIQIKKDFFALLKEHDIDRHQRWSDVKKKIDDRDSRYKAVGDSITREEYFHEYCKWLKDEKRRQKRVSLIVGEFNWNIQQEHYLQEKEREKDKKDKKKSKDKERDRDRDENKSSKDDRKRRSKSPDGGDKADDDKDDSDRVINYSPKLTRSR